MITKKYAMSLKQKIENGQVPNIPEEMRHAIHRLHSNKYFGIKFDIKDILNKRLIEIGLINENGNETKLGVKYLKDINGSIDKSKKRIIYEN